MLPPKSDRRTFLRTTAGLLLLPSVEALGLAADEALPSEIPLLTPDSRFTGVEPPDWVLDGAVKVFFPPEDHEAIAETAAASE